ncbi:cobalt-factor II C(20)-methyltransferase [Enterococcus malodoratus]|uniref:Precorrin-2 C20-methyltransferase n=1 Tax=Enterococcus malodoratus ATCC 43197 TaxID=1158601 RepID=R2P8C7_9ENTE|nr:cobalt-factor II C(20)-methyltransferase [Enterococcus malodoratus]BBM18623.1 precorrin-2 C(20)-methyltransferase [Enterococcus avium]EOH80547.1 precorrin-2 C20-methyltransferase [Enterococcus malodoratus ATCC 43197]EOT69056.1 precorrin-2 C20-methyltransferase [Enterococcus malodoratus ATCC 43197]SET49437.1 precorrin-2/cobalt-factor-2 C20-methyltransferase [Enterococcus malodoratus]SPW67270.1 Cobalt-precorrin-2 C(20)-methyltransferase [Enterococcus malodoratus]
MAKFYGVGTGPGASDLLTIRGKKIIETVDCLYTPEPKKGGKSLALQIVSPYLKEGLTIKQRHFPMVNDWDEKRNAWNEIAEEIISDVKKGLNVAFVTLGDPMVYSTYSYLLERMIDQIETETVPGISSFCQISNNLQIPLVIDEESYAVLPATANEEIIRTALEQLSTVILMKVSIALPKVLKLLTELNLLEQTILVSDSSMASEKIMIGLNELSEQDHLSYFSTMIVYKNRTLKGS